MKKPRTLRFLTAVPLFSGGLAVGWLAVGYFSGGKPWARLPDPEGIAQAAAAENGEMEPPSGLPGDFVHFSTIRDTGSLRSVWTKDIGFSAMEALARRWAELDPRGGIGWFLSSDGNGSVRGEDAAYSILRKWTDRDPAEVLNYLVTLSPQGFGSGFDGVLARLIGDQLTSDPEKALGLWERASAPARMAMVRTVMSYWFENDPDRALKEIGKVPADFRQNAWEMVNRVKDPEAIIRRLIEQPGLDCPAFKFADLFGSWVEKDLHAARLAAEALPPRPRRAAACEEVLDAMVKEDADGALEWMEANAPADDNRTLVYSAIGGQDLPRSLALFGQSQAAYSSEITSRLHELADQDWTAARALADRQPSRARREEMIGAMVDELIPAGDPAAQLEKLGGLLAGTGLTAKMLPERLWSELDGDHVAATASWLDTQPEDVRQLLLPGLFERWYSLNSAAAADWLAKNPQGEGRTTAIAQNVYAQAGQDPDAAARFSLSLPPGPDQNCAIRNTASAWSLINPAAARHWLESLPESDGRKRALEDLKRN